LAYELTRKVYKLLGIPIDHVYSDFTSFDLIEKKDQNQYVKELKNEGFSIVLGNPPYQVLDGGGAGTSAISIYNHFIDVARNINPKYISMICPARWYTDGKGLGNFRKSMLSDERLALIVDYPNPKDCFPSENISGGVCFFRWELNHKGCCEVVNVVNGVQSGTHRALNEFDVFVRYNSAVPIIHRVYVPEEKSLMALVKARNVFNLESSVRGNKVSSLDDDIIVYSSKGKGYLDRSAIKSGDQFIPRYKTLMGKVLSGHVGETDENGQVKVISSTLIAGPNEVTTDSYLVMGVFDSLYEAVSMQKYLHTRFLRFLLLQSLTSMNISRGNFRFVPLQDFTDNSDIDWSMDVADIDRKLYEKYGLTEEEIKFIESMIKPM
jgi:site-specific DNA-methyltransferase (adenine-specific)